VSWVSNLAKKGGAAAQDSGEEKIIVRFLSERKEYSPSLKKKINFARIPGDLERKGLTVT